jgi:hypothetical protein
MQSRILDGLKENPYSSERSQGSATQASGILLEHVLREILIAAAAA